MTNHTLGKQPWLGDDDADCALGALEEYRRREMNRRRRWKAKHRRTFRELEYSALLSDIESIGREMRSWKDDPDPDKKIPPPVALRPPARLRRRANKLIGRMMARTFNF